MLQSSDEIPQQKETEVKQESPSYVLLFYSLAVRPNSDQPKRAKGMLLKFPGEPKYTPPAEAVGAPDIASLRAKGHDVIDSYFDKLEKAMVKNG